MFSGPVVKHRALGSVKLPCGRWPHHINRKNMVYCRSCLYENTIGGAAERGSGEKEASPPQDFVISDV